MACRGVYLLEQEELLNCGAQAASAYRQIRDVGSSLFYLLLAQTWLTAFTAVISICSISFFSYGPQDDKFPLDLSFIGFLIMLPALICMVLAFWRREAALKNLSEVKAGLLFCWMRVARTHDIGSEQEADSPSGDTALVLQQTIFTLLDAMRIYLMMPRFYAASYPYLGIRSKMLRIAHERARQLRQITACWKKLYAGSEGSEQQLYAAHLAFERMSNVKEFRTPHALRAMIRFGISVVIPVYVGPVWAAYYNSTTSFAFALLIGTLLNVMLVVLLVVAIQLEDPFDNIGLDGIYVDETFHEIKQNILMDADAELAAGPQRFSQVRGSRAPPDGMKMSGGGPWSHEEQQGQLSPGDAMRMHPRPAHDLSFVSVYDDPPLSTDQ